MRPAAHCDEIRGSFARHPGAFPGATLLLLLVLVAPWAPALSAESDPIRLHGVTYLGDLPTFIADQRGLFAEHGLSVEVVQTSSGKQNLATLRAGETDFALMALTPLVLDRLAESGPDRPDDPVILGSVVHSTHLNQVITIADNGIRAPADLSGHRLGVMRGTNAEFMWWLFTAYHRIDPSSVELVDLPMDQLPDALVEGRIDAAVMWEPRISQLARRPGVRLRQLEGNQIYSAKWVLVTTRRTVHEKPRRSRAILAAYRDAIDFIERHPREALQAYADHIGIPLQQLQRNGETILYALSIDWSLAGSLQQQIEWAAHAGYPVNRREPALLSWIESGPLRSLAPPAVGIPDRVREEEQP